MRSHRNLKRRIFIVFLCFVAWLLGVCLYQTNKRMPDGLNYVSDEYHIDDSDLDFLYDLTYLNESGVKQVDQHIFSTIFDVIDGADQYILIDMFLFNSYKAKDDKFYKDLSKELTAKLVRKKQVNHKISIDFITDPVNAIYGGSFSPELKDLEDAGVNVIVTDLKKLRDSNFIYSAWWRTFAQWFGNSEENGFLKHPFSSTDKKVTLRSYLQLLNFKANHRKVFIADSNNQMVSIIGSANPHGGSSLHSNVALLVRGGVWKSLYEAEEAVANISGRSLSNAPITIRNIEDKEGDLKIAVLSENQIKKAIIHEISMSKSSEKIIFAHFYLSDRDVIKALIKASMNGVDIQIILDPNKDAFGYEKNGIPNRQVASELLKKSQHKIKLRWFDTHGEQFHSKLFVSERGDRVTVILGSANLTRRNLDNYNLELDVMVTMNKSSRAKEKIDKYFNRIWNNENGLYTVDFEKYSEDSIIKNIIYRVQEEMGFSTY